MSVIQILQSPRLPEPLAALRLIKPVTWFPPMWAYLCAVIGALRTWVVAGCLGSAAMLGSIVVLGQTGPGAPLMPAVVGLGVFNGVFAVAAIG